MKTGIWFHKKNDAEGRAYLTIVTPTGTIDAEVIGRQTFAQAAKLNAGGKSMAPATAAEVIACLEGNGYRKMRGC